MVRRRITYLSALVFALAVATSCSSSGSSTTATQDYPSENITFLVGYAPGGGTDTFARTVVHILDKHNIVKQSMTVRNVTGGGGAKAIVELARTENPHTLLTMVSVGHAIAIDEIEQKYSDYTPIAQLKQAPSMVVVPADSPYKSISGLTTAMKNNPGRIRWGISGRTSSESFNVARIGEAVGVEPQSMTKVPLDGASGVVKNLIAGRVDAGFIVPVNVISQLEEGNLRALAVSSEDRLGAYSNIPTLAESGIDLTATKGQGFWGPENMPQPVAKYWRTAFKKVMKTEEWKNYLKKNHARSQFLGPEQYMERLKNKGNAYAEWYRTAIE